MRIHPKGTHSSALLTAVSCLFFMLLLLLFAAATAAAAAAAAAVRCCSLSEILSTAVHSGVQTLRIHRTHLATIVS